ncbi:uncharacterized protein [Dysidea avara]|uniref:uncharacterized protein n=1 Tax=Dysidea avara TaxID=196820 RepID=UPI0033326650
MYLPGLEACIRDGNVASIMCSYNAVNGIPSCANSFLQDTIAREQWGFEDYIVSDCGAINSIEKSHQGVINLSTIHNTAGLLGGCDLNCGSYYQTHGMEAINSKTITEEDVDVRAGMGRSTLVLVLKDT